MTVRKAAPITDEIEFKDAIQTLMKHKQFHVFMLQLLEECGYCEDAMTGNSNTFNLLGMQAVGLIVTAWLEEYTPDGFAELLKERWKRKHGGDDDDGITG